MHLNYTNSLISFMKLTSFIKGSSKSIFTNQMRLQRNAIYFTDRCQLSKTVERNRQSPILTKTSITSYFSTKMSDAPAEKSSCIFCNIVNKLTDTEILFEDDLVCVFRDIKPASRYHILTIPKRHIEDCKSLTSADKDLVQHMLTVAQDMLQKNNCSLDNARLGYHWPPFRSVKHLHLHAIAPESEMGFIARLVFKKDSYWFVSPEYVASRL